MLKSGKGMVCPLATIAVCVSLSLTDASAQTYPVKPIRLIVGFSTGGVVDASGRITAQHLSQALGQQVVVENRPGASSAIANEFVARAPTDGYTLLLLASSASIVEVMRTKLPYNLERDFAPVSLVAVAPFVLAVHSSVPARSTKELIALARANPGKLTYATSGVGSAVHLAGALFNSLAKIDMLSVPYKGGGESVAGHAAGHVDISYPSIPALLPFLHSGRLRPLALTGGKRSSLLPDLPTLAEQGFPGYDRASWSGVQAPAGVSKEIVSRLHAAIVKIGASAEMKKSLNNQGLEPQTSTPEEFAEFVRREVKANAGLIKLIGIKPE